MEDTMKKILYTGIGYLSLARQKTEDVIRDLINKGKISEAEGERIMKDFKKESGSTRQALEKDIKEMMAKMLDKMDIAKKRDIAALETQITELQKRVTALEGPKK